MSGVVKKTVSAAPSTADVPADPTAGDVLALFSVQRIEAMMVEGFAVAFERRIQGTSMDALLDTLQFVADLRVFKEGLALTGEQVQSLLQISERTFDRYKKEGKIEVDPHIGTGSPRYSFFSILATRARTLQEAHPPEGQSATITSVKRKGNKRN